MSKYEAHITCNRSDSAQVQAECAAADWSFSVIDGDPLMGKTAYCYMTRYSDDARDLLRDMKLQVQRLQLNGVAALRQKIEEILYDTKTGWDRL